MERGFFFFPLSKEMQHFRERIKLPTALISNLALGKVSSFLFSTTVEKIFQLAIFLEVLANSALALIQKCLCKTVLETSLE